MTSTNTLLRNTALRICIDWLNSVEYRDTASYSKVRSASSLWQMIEHERKTSGTNYYLETEKFWIKSLHYALDQGWLVRKISRIGRPRVKDYSVNETMRAAYLLNQNSTAASTARKLASAAGEAQRESYSIITVTEELFAALLEDAPLDQFEHINRRDLAAVMGLSSRATNAFYRWLKTKGWKEKSKKVKDEAGLITRVRTLFREKL